jgi:hypothetical protein
MIHVHMWIDLCEYGHVAVLKSIIVSVALEVSRGNPVYRDEIFIAGGFGSFVCFGISRNLSSKQMPQAGVTLS